MIIFSVYACAISPSAVVNLLWTEFALHAHAHEMRLIERQMVKLKSCDKTDHNASCVEDRYRKAVTRTTGDR